MTNCDNFYLNSMIRNNFNLEKKILSFQNEKFSRILFNIPWLIREKEIFSLQKNKLPQFNTSIPIPKYLKLRIKRFSFENEKFLLVLLNIW